MGKKDQNKKKGKGAEKTSMKTDKKLANKQKRLLAKIGETDVAEVVANLEAEEARLKEVKEIKCEPPTPRSNFSICAHPEKDELIIFGGEFFNGQNVSVYNDLFSYNIAKNDWKLIKSPAGPAPRSGHQMVSVATGGGQLWLFGGEHASPSQLQFYHYKDLWTLSLITNKWEKVNAPNGPSPRSGHRMVAAKKKLIIFGGFHDNNQSYRYFNDVHMFSMETYSWLQIEVGGAILPPPRSACCIAACPDGSILVWGGYSKSQVKKDIDRGITHTDMFALLPDKSNPSNKFKWNTVKPGGARPLPRSSVGCTVAPNGKAYCFGGVMDVEEDEENLSGQFGDDLHSLDLSSNSWRLLEIQKKDPKKPKGEKVIDVEMDETKPTASVTTDGIFTVTVGGATTSSSTKLASCDKSKSKANPSARMNAGLCVSKGNLYLFGGIFEEDSKQHTLNDFYSLDLHKLDEWRTIISNNLNSHEWIDSGSESSSGSGDEETESDSSSESEMDTD